MFAPLAAAVLAASVPAAAQPPCPKDAICGLKNPEDMVRIGASRWAVASQLARNPSAPGFVLIDLKARTARPLAPDLSGPAAKDYPDCAAPALDQLLTHGMDVRMSSPERGVLYVVDHGGGHPIQVFDLTAGSDGVRLAWKGCVPTPPEMSPNGLAALPDGFAVSSFGSSAKGAMDDLMAGRPSGFVMTWSHARGWRRVEGSELPGDNGVAASRDGRTLYVDAWGDGTLHVFDLTGANAPRSVALGEVHPDNVHFTPDGRLLVAGQVGERTAALACGKEPVCPMASMAVEVDPATLRILARRIVPARPDFGAASTAIAGMDGVWFSSFLGDRIIWAPAPEPAARP